jgi:hypothetical protein
MGNVQVFSRFSFLALGSINLLGMSVKIARSTSLFLYKISNQHYIKTPPLKK